MSEALTLLPVAALAARRAKWYAPDMASPAGPQDQTSRPAPTPAMMARARRAAHLVSAVSRYGPFRGSCLERAVLLRWLLRWRSIPAEVRIGVRKADDALEAHAWIECAGTPLDEDPDVEARYTALPRAVDPRGVRFH